MQLALAGLPGAGVKTTFSAITALTEPGGAASHTAGQGRRAMVRVPDPRLELVSRAFGSKKTTPATVEVVEFPGLFGQKVESRMLGMARAADALVWVVRAFKNPSVAHIDGSVDSERDLHRLRSEAILADLEVVEGRLQRLESSLGKRPDEEEAAEREVLIRCRQALEEEKPLRDLELSPWEEKRIRGFGFLSQKPVIVLLNVSDSDLEREDEMLVPIRKEGYAARALCADLESELARLEEPDRTDFMKEFGVSELAAPVVLAAAYQTFRIVTFYTYSGDECRAWRVRQGETAVDAAAKIHTDMARGFIRAEVISFADFEEHGDVKEIKAAGKFRLEGRDYVVHDGDLIVIRHSG